MLVNTQFLIIIMVLSPLLGSIISGILGSKIGAKNSHRITIFLLFLSLISACLLAKPYLLQDAPPLNWNAYLWASSGSFQFYVGFLLDRLTCVMITMVTFVSLLVHIYSIGYMHGDSGYSRFFSYMSLFTFFMLMLVSANNFMQLFFGWEGVGLVSYLLIGFWYSKHSANEGSLKAFLVNRVGDLGFILGIAAILDNFDTLDYYTVFNHVNLFAHTTINLIYGGQSFHLLSVIAILLFIGAMGKSAQMPLHIWLPESMEGPTPISALIHAATMVTAGVFMLARMSPIFEYAPAALTFVMVIGATGALFTGLIAIVQNDIKRVVAYSTLSQLGYMVAAAGASAFSASIFHLLTHAFFKALLFLAAGSVILAMHHEQDMRKMGGLWRHLPITYFSFLVGTLALVAFPPFSGFFSKDAIISAVGISTLPGAHYAHICLLFGAYVTALYSFRALFMTFHGKEKFDETARNHLHESPWVVTLPLILLAIPSIILGFGVVQLFLAPNQFLMGHGIFVLPTLNVVSQISAEFSYPIKMILDAWHHPSFWLTIAGILSAWIAYIAVPSLPKILSYRFSFIYRILQKKYGFDELNQYIFVSGTQKLSQKLYDVSDMQLIDHTLVNGSGRLFARCSQIAKKFQSGYLYHYIFVMLVGMVAFLWWLIR